MVNIERRPPPKKKVQKLSSGIVIERKIAPSPASRALVENQRNGRRSNDVSQVLRLIGQVLEIAVYHIFGSRGAGYCVRGVLPSREMDQTNQMQIVRSYGILT